MKNTNQNGSGNGPWIPSNEEWLNAQVEIDSYLAQKKRRRLWFFFLFGFLLLGGGCVYFLGVNASNLDGSSTENQTEYANNEKRDEVISNTEESSEVQKSQTDELTINEVAEEEWKNQKNTPQSTKDIIQQSTENKTNTQAEISSNNIVKNAVNKKEELIPNIDTNTDTDSDNGGVNGKTPSSELTFTSQERRVIVQKREDLSKDLNQDDKGINVHESPVKDESATTVPLTTLMEGVAYYSSWDISRPTAYDYNDEINTKSSPLKWNPTLGFSGVAFMNQEISKSQIGAELFAGMELTYKKKWILDIRLKGRLLSSDFGPSNVIKQEKASLGESFDRWTITPKQLYQAGLQMGVSYTPNDKHRIGVFGTMYRTLGVVGNVDFYRYDALQDKIDNQGEEFSNLGKLWIKDHNIQKLQCEFGVNYTRPIYRNMYFESSVVYRLNQGRFWSSDLGDEQLFLELTEPWPALGIQIGIKWKL